MTSVTRNILFGLLLGCGLFFAPAVQAQKPVTPGDTALYSKQLTPFENDLDKLVEIWAAQAFEGDCTPKGEIGPATDSVYMERLYAMPCIMEMPFNGRVKSCIELYVVKRKSTLPYLLGMSQYYFPIFEKYLNAYGLPLELRNLAIIESALNPTATSPVGAGGLWQFMPGTAKSYGLEINSLVDERCDPFKETDAACRLLRDLYAIYHDWHLVIAAYNCGPGNVNKAIARAGGKRDFWAIYNYLPEETRNYVPIFIGATYATTYYAEHGICPKKIDMPVIVDTVMISQNLNLNQVAQVLDIPLNEIQRLNPAYRRNVIPGSKLKKYPLCLPLGELTHYMIYCDSVAKYKASEYLPRRDTVVIGTGQTRPTVTPVPASSDSTATTAPAPLKPSTSSSTSSSTTKPTTTKPSTSSSSSTVKKPATPAVKKPTTTYYTAKSGDSLSRIAARYGCTTSDLRKWNGLKSDKVSIGQKFKIIRK